MFWDEEIMIVNGEGRRDFSRFGIRFWAAFGLGSLAAVIGDFV